jgi:hypothetical protein
VKATGPDWWPDITMDPGLTENRFIQAIQIIPTKGYPNIHHIRTSMVKPGDDNIHGGAVDGNVQLDMTQQGVFLDEYAIGKGPDVFKEGSGRYITAGTKINFEFHLHSNGTETPVNVLLGLKFYPKGYTPQHTVTSMTMGSNLVDLRPHEANVRSDGFLTLIQPTRLLSFQPHMHTRGKAECIEAIYPNGKTETMSCARFQFNWMNNYVYADDAAPLLPAGTILHTEDSGAHWTDQTSETNAVLYAVHFSDKDHGGAVGALGTILLTEDGGLTWTAQETQSAATFFDVFFTDQLNGWAVGNAGAMFQTTDGGKRWIDRTLACLRSCSRPTDLIKVRFTSQKAGWIVGERGSIFRTTDAGFTWVEQENGTKASLFGLSFPDPNHGWASGERGTILHIMAR